MEHIKSVYSSQSRLAIAHLAASISSALQFEVGKTRFLASTAKSLRALFLHPIPIDTMEILLQAWQD